MIIKEKPRKRIFLFFIDDSESINRQNPKKNNSGGKT